MGRIFRVTLLMAALSGACGKNEDATRGQFSNLEDETPTNRGCLERARPADQMEARQVQPLLALLAMSHTGMVRWQDGSVAELTMNPAGAEPVVIESREDPDFHLDVERQCESRVRFAADIQLQSSDGRLNEQLTALPFELNGSQLQAAVTIKRDLLRGAYVTQNAVSTPPVSIRIAMTLGEPAFTGQVTEQVATFDGSGDSPVGGQW